ncbi:MAG: GyrI-like domain-containing protein [Acidimicrobiales bacterium]
MAYEVITREIPDQRVVSQRGLVIRAGLSAYIGSSYDALMAGLGPLGIEPNGEPVVIYHEWSPTRIDVEVCLPVGTARPIPSEFEDRVIPAATVAQTLHVGRYEELPGAYRALETWIRDNDYEEVGPTRERYLVGPGSDAPETEYRTLIETPVAKALVTAG